MSSKVTMQDIADDMGLSIATVHRALRNNGRINEKTKESITRRAFEMGYRPVSGSKTSYGPLNLKFAFICPDNVFYWDIIRGAQIAEKEHKNTKLQIDFLLSDGYNVDTQIKQLNDILEFKNYNGVAICPLHTMLLNPLIDSLVDAGIPVVTFNNDVPQSKRVCFVGENSLVSGRFAAELYSSILPKGAKVALFQSLVSADGLKMRVRGFNEYVSENPGIEIVGTYDYYDNIKSAYEFSKQLLLTSLPDAIYVNSMFGTIGIAQALKELNKRPLLIGYDLVDDIMGYVDSQILWGTLYQFPSRQGYIAVKALYKLSGVPLLKSSARTIYMPTNLVVRSNMDQYINNDELESSHTDFWNK